MINKNIHLKKLKRSRILENRDLKYGLRLDRNEKIDNWDKQKIINLIKKQPDSFFSTYPNITNLYKKIAKHAKVKENQILVTNGIDGSIRHLLEHLTSPNKSIAVLSPTYAMYKVYAQIFKLKIYELNYNNDLSINFDNLFKILNKNISVLFIPSPNQPIDTKIDKDKLEKIITFAKRKNTYVVIDEAYFLFGMYSTIPFIKKHPNLFVMRTFSKGFGMPSIRVGYTVGSEINMNIISKSRIAHELGSLNIILTEFLLDNIDIVKNNVKKIIEGRKYVKNQLKKINIKAYGNYGNYLFIKLKSDKEVVSIKEHLSNKKIYIKASFSKPWSQFILITIGPKKYMEKFIKEINKFYLKK